MGKTFAAYSDIRTSNGLAHRLFEHSQRPLASYEISFIKLFCAASLHDKRITSTHQISIPLRVRFFRKPLDCSIANIEFLPVGDATTTFEPISNNTASLEVDLATRNITVREMNT